ncbi:MAG: CHAD domain-containing protein [Candidatus Omnitrophica bacterium]|nr:CHAD domain-containing protein [Candidatus Omnitrophota bacterium]
MKKVPSSYIKRIILKHLRRFIRELDGARAGDDPEHVHQVRVSSRRLRNALSVFEEFLPEERAGRARESVKKVAGALSEARDVDTQIAFFRALSDDFGADAEKRFAGKVIKALSGKRKDIQAFVVKALDEFNASGALGDIDDILAVLPKTRGEDSRAALEVFAARKIKRRLSRLLSYGDYAATGRDEERLHLMRLAAKKLRYTLENFRPIFGRGLDRHIKAAHNVQNMLGEFNDLNVWIKYLSSLVAEAGGSDPELPEAVRHFTEKCAGMKEASFAAFDVYWRSLIEAGAFKELKKAL